MTSWPSPAFTPRRWPLLSRPFFELEPAFLCAIASYSSFLVRLRAGLGAAADDFVAAFLAVDEEVDLAAGLASALGFSLLASFSARAASALALASADLSASALACLASAAAACCLLGGAATGRLDIRHADDGQFLAMAMLDTAARLRPVLEDDDLLATVGPKHLAGNLGPLDDGRPDQRVLAVGDEQDTADLDAGPDPRQTDQARAPHRARRGTACRRFRLLRTWILPRAR